MRQWQRWLTVLLTVGIIFLFQRGRSVAAGLEAEMVIYNGKILTADSPHPANFRTASAAAI